MILNLVPLPTYYCIVVEYDTFVLSLRLQSDTSGQIAELKDELQRYVSSLLKV